tara:strand:+ start:1490 stop:1921 length:432 start_codon:yes stop_codon:yes gene_type:complete
MILKEINKIKYMVEEIQELPFGSIDGDGRTREVSMARMVVGGFIVCDLGIDLSKCARLMNRDRTSFYFYRRKHKEYLSDKRIYPEYVKLYETLYDKYMNSNDAILKENTSRVWLEQLEDLKQEQKNIDRKMLALEAECKLLGL